MHIIIRHFHGQVSGICRGAVESLKKSLRFNKKNIQARNLLGLVYFEMGETVSALSEWVISKNFKPENNIAGEYLDEIQKNRARLESINQTIKKYNQGIAVLSSGQQGYGDHPVEKGAFHEP